MPVEAVEEQYEHAWSCERVFDHAMIEVMLSVHEIEGLRGSHAMAPLSQSHVVELLESCEAMARERQAIAEVLSGLAPPFGDLRKALNDLQHIVKG